MILWVVSLLVGFFVAFVPPEIKHWKRCKQLYDVYPGAYWWQRAVAWLLRIESDPYRLYR